MAKWVSDEFRSAEGFGQPDKFGRTTPLAVYSRSTGGEMVYRNLSLVAAEELADRESARGNRVHVSVDSF